MSVVRPDLGRTINVDAAQHGSHGSIRASTIPAIRRHGRALVAQWFTVDIAAVEYTQTLFQLAVGEPLRIVHKHRPLIPEWPALGVRQQIVARSGRVNDETSSQQSRRISAVSVYGVSSVRLRRPTTSSILQVDAISHAHYNHTNLPLQDCLLDEGNAIIFVVIVLSLPACVSRLPQCQPLHDIPLSHNTGRPIMVPAHRNPGT